MELSKLPVLGADPTNGTGDRAHHHGFRLNRLFAEAHTFEHRTGCDTGGREQAIAAHHVFHIIALARILDTHLHRALALIFGIEDEPALHLPADATQRSRRQHAFRRTADADVDVDAGCR